MRGWFPPASRSSCDRTGLGFESVNHLLRSRGEAASEISLPPPSRVETLGPIAVHPARVGDPRYRLAHSPRPRTGEGAGAACGGGKPEETQADWRLRVRRPVSRIRLLGGLVAGLVGSRMQLGHEAEDRSLRDAKLASDRYAAPIVEGPHPGFDDRQRQGLVVTLLVDRLNQNGEHYTKEQNVLRSFVFPRPEGLTSELVDPRKTLGEILTEHRAQAPSVHGTPTSLRPFPTKPRLANSARRGCVRIPTQET
jgi:hypothetical protein